MRTITERHTYNEADVEVAMANAEDADRAIDHRSCLILVDTIKRLRRELGDAQSALMAVPAPSPDSMSVPDTKVELEDLLDHAQYALNSWNGTTHERPYMSLRYLASGQWLKVLAKRRATGEVKPKRTGAWWTTLTGRDRNPFTTPHIKAWGEMVLERFAALEKKVGL